MNGLGTSPGIAIGKAFIYETPEIIVEKIHILDIDYEIARLDSAIEEVKKDIQKLYDLSLDSIGESDAEIFNAHLMILEDPELYSAVTKMIKDNQVNCEWALKKSAEYFISLFEGIEDEYLKARASDIKDVTDSLMRCLLDIKPLDLSQIDKDSIIIAQDLTPRDTIKMNRDKVSGFITKLGGKTSHTAIMARLFEIPAIAGVKDIFELVKNGDIVAMDGENGEFLINPNKEEIQIFEKKLALRDVEKEKLLSMKGKPSISQDGHKVQLAGNIGSVNEINHVLIYDGEGVGLFRTEFLFMDKDSCPSEEDQFLAYKEAAEKLGNRPLIIRTLDIGGDKDLFYLNLPKELNPFLGYRAIRLCLDQEDMFKIQLKAILRASSYGNVKVMFPMISSIKELRDTKSLINGIREELRKDNIPFNDDMEIGIMVEVPAVAIQSRKFAKEVDFFSIGTNDLIQYTLAVDRGNHHISELYNHYHPAVLNLINTTIENAHKEGIWVGMCGEAAGDEKLIPLLLGMGIDELSMSPSSILRARYIVRNTSKEEVYPHLDTILNLATAEEVEEYLEGI
ncbi:phosphoenolpyruvate--protein phosphotransferase [Tissierella creatinini]|nr:phosphoenolpyruvate--protein phosphotransferase [Tissierella creatinini]TJX61494.1 phosphoenolpyruvate--protein phosphotransferase [Soehngenia saccharolytica]